MIDKKLPRKATEIERDIRKSKNFFNTIQLLKEAGEGYRHYTKYNDRVMYAHILERHGAYNINNNIGMFCITF